MYDNSFQPSLTVDSFLGENPSLDTEKFLLFIKAYYEWMQTTSLSITGVVGTFVRDETVVGTSSGTTGVIKEVADGVLVVKSTARTPFYIDEIITGQTSGATATVSIVKDNVIKKSGKLLDYRTIELSVDKYVDFLKEELYSTIPKTVYGNERLLAKKYKDFFESKSNEESYRFLFRHLYNQEIDLYYPGVDILRISDGDFEKTQIVRVAVTNDIFGYLNKTILGVTSGALANVVDITKFFVGATEVAELTLSLVSGTFIAGETVEHIDADGVSANTQVYGILSGFTINDAGSGYAVNDIVTITGNGSQAQAIVSSIKQSPITALSVSNTGYGYRLNTEASINNSGTGGTGLIVRVTELANTYTVTSGANTYTLGEASVISVINRGSNYYKSPSIALEDSVISSLGLMSENLITIVSGGTNYGVGNNLIFTGGSGTSVAGKVASVVESISYDLLFEDGYQMKVDGSYYDIIKNEDWSVKGPIKRVELTNYGTGYTTTSLPVITVSSTTGASANLIATNIQGKSANVSIDVANNATGIGSIRAIQITNFGIGYTAANANVSLVGDGNANVTPVISGLGIKEGNWITDDGKIGYKKIQDSYYYQDFSYVIKSGLVFDVYKDNLKKIIHPAGLQAFGEILLYTELDLSILMSSTIDTIENIDEYILHIISYMDVQPSVFNSRSIVNREFDLQANNAIQTGNEKWTISPNRDLISIDFGVSSKIDFHVEVDALDLSNLSATSSTNFSFVSNITASYKIGDVSIFWLSADQILNYSSLNFETAILPTKIYLTAWKLIQGTVSFSSYAYSLTQISDYANTQISALELATFSSSVNHVTGLGTIFLVDFAVNDTFLANNEFGKVSILMSNTSMDIYVPPVYTYTGVPAYKIVAGP